MNSEIGSTREIAHKERPPMLHTINDILYGKVLEKEVIPSAFNTVSNVTGLSALRRKSQLFVENPYNHTCV